MYNKLYEPLPDLQAYLKRIGLSEQELRCDRESLDRLIRAHLTCIPFENLDAWAWGKSPVLDMEGLFNKIILHRRGGWCFELNSLFNALLRALGFDSYMVAAHVMADREVMGPPFHCCVVCSLGGEKYFCDVGYGGAVPFGGLKFSGESGWGFHIEQAGLYTRLVNESRAWTEILFKDVPVSPTELVSPNYYMAENPTSPFRTRLYLNLRLENGSVGLIEHEFKLKRGEQRLERYIESGEVAEILEEHFGISSDGIPLREIGEIL